MKRVFVLLAAMVLSVGVVFGGVATSPDPGNGRFEPAPCPCFYTAPTYVAETVVYVDNPHGGFAPVYGIIVLDGSYCPAKQKLNFTVQVTFTQNNCTSSLLHAYGHIGPYSFYMTETSFIMNGVTFPVTPNLGGGPPWIASGALTEVTGFDCNTWYLQIDYQPQFEMDVKGVACIGFDLGTRSAQFSIFPQSASYFSCTCQ